MGFNAAAFQEFERSGWDAKAAAYHRFYRSLTAPAIEPLLDAAGAGVGTVVLDVGCGPGYVSAAAAGRGATAFGIDQSLAMARIAAAESSVAAIVGDAQHVPIRDGVIDAVIGNFVLHHLPDSGRALAEFERILRIGGAVALTVWDTPDRCRFLGVFNDSVRLAGAQAPATIPVGPIMVANDNEYAATFARAHLVPKPVKTLSWNHTFADADELWDGLLSASVRTAALITEQSPTVQQRIRDIYDELVVDYVVDDHLVIPVSVKLLSGSRARPPR